MLVKRLSPVPQFFEIGTPHPEWPLGTPLQIILMKNFVVVLVPVRFCHLQIAGANPVVDGQGYDLFGDVALQ